METTTILIRAFIEGVLVGGIVFGTIYGYHHYPKYLAYSFLCTVVFLIVYGQRAIAEEHHDVMYHTMKMKGTDKLQQAERLIGAEKNTFETIGLLGTYLSHLGMRLIIRMFRELHRLHEHFGEILAKFTEYVGYFMAKILYTPFYYIMSGLEYIVSACGLQFAIVIQYARDALRILSSAWSNTIDEMIKAWFGEGKTDDDTHNKFIIYLFTSVIVKIMGVLVLCWVIHKAYLVYMDTPVRVHRR